MNMDILELLNKEQRQAVVCNEGKGPLLVLAGAGSGKTRILTSRIIYMIQNNVDPSHILAVTFTNKAAQEMKHRIRAVIDYPVMVGTFHSTCLSILRMHAERVGLKPDFTIYDDIDQLAVIKECMKELGIDSKKTNPKGIRERISMCKDLLKTVESAEEDIVSYEDKVFHAIFKKYQGKLMKYNGVDFGDLIFKTVRLFSDHEDVLSYYQERFQYILVDEYQDTNIAQYVFVNLLAQQYRNITVVGDPDQSIYAWRGANIENILNFEKDYKGATVIRLEQNYRSTNNILRVANKLITHNINRKSKELWSEKGDGELIDMYRAINERDEARHLVSKIIHYLSEGYVLRDLVVFYRIHAQSRVIEEELRRNNINYKIIGGVKFYARKEIKDILAYMRVIDNLADELSLRRIINSPKRGIGKRSLERIVESMNIQTNTFFEAIAMYAQSEEAPKRVKKSLAHFVGVIKKLCEQKHDVSLQQLVEAILDKTAYVSQLQLENTMESRMRLENIEEFINSIAEFEQSLPHDENTDVLRRYLEFISLQTSIDQFDEQEDVFTLMTIHCAKGLEFPIVFIVGLEEDLLPHSNSLQSSFKEVEEERRLCYVGFTRAQEKLCLSYAMMRKLFGYEKMVNPSRFLKEIPQNLISASYDLDNLYDLDDDGFDEFDQTRQNNYSWSQRGRSAGRNKRFRPADDEDIIYY
ncbi:ATP-dependent helicase [Candidatus Omnitrophota bacterium]